ncbi:hypothetical protein [Streptomyces sp. NPDC017964]|uniref:hypothetical protein n=1 Tax=Streptomyces sp. NPDC017964 TaxID=3365022 RepID=UPI0037B6DD07
MRTVDSSWYESGTFWTVSVGAAATILGVVLGAWLTNKFNNPKRRLEYEWRKNTSLLETSSPTGSSLRVQHGTATLAHPRVIDIMLRNSGKKEIVAVDFHAGAPIEIALDCVVVEIKNVATAPSTSLTPAVSISPSGRDLLVSPSLLVGGQEVVISVVADGPGDETAWNVRSPLVGIDPKFIERVEVDRTDPLRQLSLKFNRIMAPYTVFMVLLMGIVLMIQGLVLMDKLDPPPSESICRSLSAKDAKSIGCR